MIHYFNYFLLKSENCTNYICMLWKFFIFLKTLLVDHKIIFKFQSKSFSKTNIYHNFPILKQYYNTHIIIH